MKDTLFNKLFHPPEYPSQLPSKKGKLAYWYHWHMRLMDMGRGQVFGKVTQLFTEAGFFLLILDKLGYAKLSILQMILLCIGGMILVWIAGWVFVYLKLDITQQILTRYRDIMFKELHDTIKGKQK
jgi:hypothetical protein